MLFTDPCFLFLFLPLALALYYLSPGWLKNTILLTASILFYAAGNGNSVILILFSMAFNFCAGLLIGKQHGNLGRKAALALGVAVNLGLLIYFKYTMFLVRNMNGVLSLENLQPLGMPQINLPLGISFFTFHAISYLMDVYRGQAVAMKRPLDFSLDFSGYTDMAVGLGAMFGFVFPENFNYPYVATSVTDFWRRWHITLSSWFRDYVYILMGGNRQGRARMYFNLLAVFFLCGLWHGAMWTFVAWGLFHGVFLILERAALGVWLEKHRIIRHAYVLAVVLVGWCLFRAEFFDEAGHYLLAMAFLGGRAATNTSPTYGNSLVTAGVIAGVIFSMPVVPWIKAAWMRITEYRGSRSAVAESVARLVELGVLQTLLISSAAKSAAGTYNPFIYFRF